MLNRGMIDLKLSNEVTSMVSQKMNSESFNPVGDGLATMCLCIASTIMHMDATPQQRGQVLMDISRFMQDLCCNGWEFPDTKPPN